MNILLIKPLLTRGPHYDVGLAYIASSLERDHKIRLLDMAFHVRSRFKYLRPNLEEFSPGAIIFSVNSFHFHNALKIASFIRKLYPDTPLIYTGVHPTLLAEETIAHPLVDLICIGEGEDALRECLDKLQDNREPKDVPGIWYKDKSGSVIKNSLRPFRQDLDSLPFPNWDYFEMDKCLKLCEPFRGGIKIFSTRGCPYDCSFCISPAIKEAVPGRFYRVRSPENIIEEIKINLGKYYGRGYRHVKFGDDIFGMDLNYLEKFCALFVKAGLSRKLSWSCQTRADIITPEWASLAKSSGCAMVSFGVESGDELVRMRVYNKSITNAQIEEAVKILKKEGILYRMNILVCGPEDSAGTMRNSLEFTRRMEPALSLFYLYRALPGTALGETSKNRYFSPAQDKGDDYSTQASSLNRTRHLHPGHIRFIFIKIQLRRMLDLAVRGLKLRGLFFIPDAMRQLSCILKIRAIIDGYLLVHLECSTVVRYLWENNNLKNTGSSN